MEVLLNELSLHGQFNSAQDFHNAMIKIIFARGKLKQFGKNLHCHRNFLQAKATTNFNLREVLLQIGKIDRNVQMSVMTWLTKEGPFWSEDKQHDSDEYLEHINQIVTDSALGEAAYRSRVNAECHIFSFFPSNWQFDLIPITWHRNDSCTTINVPNHWEVNSLETALKTASKPIKSWEQLAVAMSSRCQNLKFSTNSFEYLYPYPFVDSAAKRIVELLLFLDKFKNCFDEQGKRTDEGNRLYQDHFTGDKAWFTDSSDSELIDFKKELTFNHPTEENKNIVCTWHGKIKTPQLRIHFSWPIRYNETLYVPYIGPKITKR